MAKYKIVHYINQFFAGIGGEEKANYMPEIREDVVGPGKALKSALGPDYDIVATIICGDNYFGENLNGATDKIINMIEKVKPDVFVAGPAFNAGRYGVACGTICKAVEERLGIPVITAEYEENPGTDMFKKDVIIVKTGSSSADMRNVMKKMAIIIKKMATEEEILGPDIEGYHERGIRVNYFADERASERAIKMLVKKIKGEEFKTDLPMPTFDKVEPAEPIKDIKNAKIAIVTSGGIVPVGNPDHIESSNATKFGVYSIEGMDEMTSEKFTTVHGGYDRQFVMENPNLVVPLDVLSELKKEGEFGELVEYFCSTTGTGTATGSAAKFGDEIGKRFIDEHVDGVILVSTWGTCTRCGATMVKGIEKYGIPVVHMATVVPISVTIGANRIIPGVGIPYPLGDPRLGEIDSKNLRKKMVRRALKALTIPVEEQTIFEKDNL